VATGGEARCAARAAEFAAQAGPRQWSAWLLQTDLGSRPQLQWRSTPQGSCPELASDGSRLERPAKCPHGVGGGARGCRTHHLRLSAGIAAEEFAEILQPHGGG